MFINEDYLAKWIVKNNGLILSRSENNMSKNKINIINQSNKPTLVCITGYKNIINQFFTNVLKLLKNKVILICIESDIIEFTEDQINNNNILHIFTWNKFKQHKKITCLPIGLNFKRQYSSIINFISNHNTVNNKLKLICYNCNLSTNKERQNIKSDFMDKLSYIKPLSSSYIFSHIEQKIKIDITDPKCYESWNKYKYILSPRGAGLDCHRTWEAIILNINHNKRFNKENNSEFKLVEPICIPVVKSSEINELYKDLPVLIVDSYDLLTEELLEEMYDSFKSRVYNMNKLQLKYWQEIILKKQEIIQNIHFITYGDDKYKSSRERLAREAKVFQEFKSISIFSPQLLSPDFSLKYQNVLSQQRGGGYWLWKLDIIKQSLNKINENDFLLYMDAGCKLNSKAKAKFFEYIHKLNQSKYGILSFQMVDQPENKWTTKEIFQYFNLNPDLQTDGQYIGGILLMKKCDHLRTYISEFEKCIKHNQLLITDTYNNNQANYFKENRHDQSISSLIRKKIGSVVIDNDDTFIIPFGKGKSLNYPFWAIRSKI